MSDSKIFIIGLPRTGTTSLCALMLELGYRVAHTAFTVHAFERAQVIADTPAYCDYPELDSLFPNSRFIYLQRSLDDWLPSIEQLLLRMDEKLQRRDGFHPVMKRCFETVFSPLNLSSSQDHEHLADCYRRHRAAADDYFSRRPGDYLSLELSSPQALLQICGFLDISTAATALPHLNRSGKISQWQKIRHNKKVASHLSGPGGRRFLDYCAVSDSDT